MHFMYLEKWKDTIYIAELGIFYVVIHLEIYISVHIDLIHFNIIKMSYAINLAFVSEFWIVFFTYESVSYAVKLLQWMLQI